MKRSTLMFASTLALAVVAAPFVGSIATAQSSEEKAQKIVEAVDEYYATLEHARLVVGIDAEQGDQKIKGSANVAFARPNMLRILAENADHPSIVSDGTDMIVYDADGDRYMQKPAPRSLGELYESVGATVSQLSETGGVEMSVLDLLTEGMSGSIVANATKVRYVELETIDDVPMHHLAFTADQQGIPLDIDVWVEKGDVPHVRRIVPDYEGFLRASAEAFGQDPAQLPKASLEISYRDWSVEKPAAALFAVKAPEGAEKVDALNTPREFDMGNASLVGDEAPTFQIETLDGTFDLAAQRGKVVVLDFWATWCKPCVRGLPIVTSVAKEFGDDVVFVAVNLRESKQKIQAFLVKSKIDMTVAMDSDGGLARRYQVGPIPHTTIIGKDGRVEAVHVGFSPDLEEKFRTELTTLVEGGHLAETE